MLIEGRQDALGVAKLATKSGMKGILYKTIVGRKDPAGTVAACAAGCETWCEENGLTPVHLGPAVRSRRDFFRRSSRNGRREC